MAARAIPGTSYGYQTQKNKESGSKTCHITVGEVIFQIEHGQYRNLEQLVSLLIVVWTCLANRIESFQDVQSVFQFIYRETGKAILSKSFPEINQNYKRGLSRILVQCSEVLENKVPNAAKLCSSLVMCIYDPWSDPAIYEIINNENVDENLVADFVSLEPVDLLLLRIESLVSVGSENSAIRLCRFCLKSESLAHSVKQQQKESFCLVENWKLPFMEWLLRILFRKRLLNEFVAESAACCCHDGVTLINNVQKCNNPDSETFAETLINVFLIRDLLFQKSYCCTKELMTLWCNVQVKTNKSVDEVKEASRQLLNGHASSSAHFYLFIDCLWEKYGISLVPLYLEMFIRGLSSDLNFLEAARQADDKEAVIEIENNMAAVYLKISTLLCDISKEISLECMLSSFSLDPTQEKLDLIRRLSFQISAERSKRILTNSRLKAASKNRCGKDQDIRTVLANGLPKRKNCVVTCDRGIQVGESSYVNDDVNSSFVKAYSSCHTVMSRSEDDVRCFLSSIISQVVGSETKSVTSVSQISHHSDSDQVTSIVKSLMGECLVHVQEMSRSADDSATLLNDFQLCKADDFIPLISNESSSELCMESASSMSEPSQEPPCLTPIYDEASLLINTGISASGEINDCTRTTAVIHDAVKELIGVVVDALGHDKESSAVKPVASYVQSDIDTTKRALTSMVSFNTKNVVEKLSQCNTNSIDSKKSLLSAVGNNLGTKQVLKLCDGKISKENGSSSNVCDIDFTYSTKDQPIISNGIAVLNGNLSDSDKISIDISKSKKIIDPQMKMNVNSISDTYNVNCIHPTFNNQSCDKTLANTLQHVGIANHHMEHDADNAGALESRLFNGDMHTKNCETIASSGKVMPCDSTGPLVPMQKPLVTCSIENVNGTSRWTPINTYSSGNVSANCHHIPTITYNIENGDFRQTPTISHSVTNKAGNFRQTPPLSNFVEIVSAGDQIKEPYSKKYCKVDHVTHFRHVVLEADIPGVSRSLLSDFVIVLESLRNPQLRSTRRWNKLKDACKEYLQSVTSQRCKFLNSQLNESVDSEGDSTSEMTAAGDRDFASFQSDSVYNDPYVDRTPVLRRFMNDENSPKFNAFLNLADVQNLYMPLDKILRADASSSHHDHLKHHRKHRNKERDPKKQALRHLRHNSRHNRDVIKKKKKKRRKGKKDKSHSKKRHSAHNKNGRDGMTNKKKRRLKKKKESPIEFLPGDYCSDFSSAELMRLVNEHSNNFPQTTAATTPHVSNNISSGESDLLLNCVTSKKKSKQVNFKKIKAKKNSIAKTHEKHKHNKSKPERKDKKKSPNITKLNAVKDYSHIVQFSSVKQMQSVQIRQSSVAVDLANVRNDTQNNLTLTNSTADAENLESSIDPTVKTCSQEELMNIQMLLANKEASGDNEDGFGKSFVISSNKQSCSVLKYVSSKTTSHLLSVAKATNQMVMPNSDPPTSFNKNSLMPSSQFRPQGSKSLLNGRKILPASEHISSKTQMSMCSSASKAQSRNIKKYTSPLITTVSFPVTQSMQSSGGKLVTGQFVIPLGGCIPSTSGTTTHSKIGEIMVTAGSGVCTSPKSNVFIVKGNTSPQLSVQSLLAASKNSNNLRIPISPMTSSIKNATYLNKVKPNVVKKVVKKYMPVMQKSIVNSEPGLNKQKITSSFVSPAVTQDLEPLSMLPSDIQQPKSSLAKDSKPETIVDTVTAIETPITIPMTSFSLALNEAIKSIINDLLLAVVLNSELVKPDSIRTNISVSSTSVTIDAQKEEVPIHSTLIDSTPESNVPLHTTLEGVGIATELPSEFCSADDTLKPTKGSLELSGHIDTMSENSSDSVLAATTLVSLKENVTAVKSIANSPEHKTTFFSESSSSPFGTQTETAMIATLSTPRSTSSTATKAGHSHSVEKLQPLTIGMMSAVRPHGVVASAQNKVEGMSHTDTPTRSLASISDAVRFSLMDMDDATGSVENQVLQAFNAFPQEAVGYGSQVSEASGSAMTASATSQIVTQSSQTFQASIRTSQSESFAECQISASETTEWNTNDPLVSPGASGKAHETDSAGELKDDEPVKKKRKKKDKIERDPETLQRFWCEICNRGFFSAYNLRRHCRNVHKMDLPKGTSDVPFTTSNSQCLAQVGARVICTTVPDSQEAQAVAQQLSIANKASEFILQSPTHDPKTKEFALQTSPTALSKPIQSTPQPLKQQPSFPLHSPPPPTVQTPTSLPISPVKDFRLQPVTSVALGQAQHSSFMPVTNTIPKPVPKFQRLPTANTTTPPHGLSRIGTAHQPSATAQTPQQTGIMPPSSSIQKPTETQAPNLVQPLPCQVQQIQQTTQCALSQAKKQDQRVGMLQAAQHAAQEQALRQARHAAELQQVQRAMQQAKKSVAASQLSKAEALQQSQAQISPTSSALSHLQSPILNPQMQKLVQIRQAALCGTPEFALQLSNQTGTSDLHTSPIKSPLQYFQAQVPSTQHPAILHSAVRQTLASCTATRQNQVNQNFPGPQIQNMSNAEFLSRIVPHSNAERSSCSQTFPAMSAADLCLVSSQMHMPIIRQAETNEGLEDLEQFLLENMPWSGEQITSQGIVQHSLNRMGTDPVALPIPVKPGTVIMQQPKNMSLTRNKQTISKPKPYKPPVPSLTKNLGGNKGSSVKKKASLKKTADVSVCSETNKTGFVPSVVNTNAKNLIHCPKLGEKSLVGCTSGVTAEAHVSSNLNENDSHSSDSVQCIEITQSSQPLKVRSNSVSTSFNPFPQREASGVTDVPGFYNVGLKRIDHPAHCTPVLAEAPRVSSNLLVNNLNPMPHLANAQHMTTISQPSSAISSRHPAIPPKPALNVHCNEHILNLPSSKTQETKINCAPKLPLKPSIRKFSEPLPKSNENLSPMDKNHDQVNPVIPIFDPNPLQNDNVDAEKEFNNLQSKISDCEKHLKNSESKDELKNNPESGKSITLDSSTTNPEKKSDDSSPEKLASLSQKHSPDGPKFLSPEKVGKVPKGIHFLDEHTEPTGSDVKRQENKEAHTAKSEHKEAKSMLPKNCVPELDSTSHENFTKGPLLAQKTILPFLYSHSERPDTSAACYMQNSSSNSMQSLCCNSADVSTNSTHPSYSPAKICHSAIKNSESEVCISGGKKVESFDQNNGSLVSGSSIHKSLDHADKVREISVTDNKKKTSIDKTRVTEHDKSITGSLVAEKNIYPNIFSPSKLIEKDAKKTEESSTKDNNSLLSVSTPLKNSTPVNGKDVTTEREILKCNLKQSAIQNSNFNSNAVRDNDANGDTECAKAIDILLSPVKQGELDGPATIGRTRLRDMPKTSVKRSCPCCTDSGTPKKCLVRSGKMMSPTKLSSNSKTKNLLIVKTKVTNGPAAPVQTRSSHRLRSKTGT